MEEAAESAEEATEDGTGPGRYEPDGYWYPSPLPASWQVPDAGMWQPARPGQNPEPPTRVDPGGPAAPVVGPTAALRGCAGGPGFAVKPDGTPADDDDVASRSGWQLAHGVWRGSGIRWEEPGIPAADPEVPAYRPDGPRYPAESPVPREADYAAAPTLADSPPYTESPAYGDMSASGRTPGYGEVPGYGEAPGYSDAPTRADGSAINEAQAYSDAPTLLDGLDAADYPAFPDTSARTDASAESAYAGVPSAYASVPPAYAQPYYQASPVYPSSAAYPAPAAYATQAADGALVAYGAPVGYGAPSAFPGGASGLVGETPDATRPEAIAGTPMRTEEADERFQAWRDSVHEASAPRARPVRRRRVGWQLARVGVPAAIIVTVGAGAVMMLTGKSSEMLGDRADRSPQSTGNAPATGQGAGAGRNSGFAGYPGQRGTVVVSSIASSGGTQLAVGSADGHAAIWRRGASGTWSLVSAGQPAVFQLPGMADLASVAVGRAGWIAVGDASGGHPVLVTSPDGTTWHPLTGTGVFAGPGLDVTAVAAGSDGYVVVGKQVAGARQFAAMWWSPDLRNWVRAGNGHLDGGLAPSAVYSVTATAAGFVAVGGHDGHPAIWTTRTGLSWSPRDLPQPAGTTTGALRFAAAKGGTVVAAGEADAGHETVPFVMASTGAAQDWRMVQLPASGGGTVTALTASGTGFVAAGEEGPASGRHAVTWASPDGVTWSAAAPAAGAHAITALAGSGNATIAASEQGAGPFPLTLPAP